MNDMIILQDKAVNRRNYLRGTVKRVSIFQDIFQISYFVKINEAVEKVPPIDYPLNLLSFLI